MNGDDGPGTDPDGDPELTLSAVVRGETRIRWSGILVFLPGRVLMGCLGISLLGYYGALALVEDDPTIGGASRAIPEGWTIYPVAFGTATWLLGVALLLASRSVPGAATPAFLALVVGWVVTTAAVALDERRSEYPAADLDRVVYLFGVAVPVLTGVAGAIYVSGRMQRAKG